jgi:hypothetical protein
MRRFRGTVVSLFVLLVLTGCRGGGSSAKNAGLPPSGNVRIVAKQLQEDANTFQWQWTVIGDRNWMEASIDGSNIMIGSSYPFNSKSKTGGTQVWDITVTLQKKPGAAQGTVDKLITVRGSNGTTANSNGFLTLTGGSLKESVRVLQPTETTMRLPVNLPLVSIGKQDISLRVSE